MAQAMAHRGPDAEGIWQDEDVLFIHRRLSIIDLDHVSDQPFLSDDGRFAIVFNGEIYNFRDLKRELGGDDWRTASDTEVLMKAYAKWGRACLDKLEGMFAFAIWDRDQKLAFLARDRMGIKPLYVYYNGSVAVFASELRTLLASDQVPRRLDRIGLDDYLRFQTVHAPRTILENVRILGPGSFVEISCAKFEEQVWWEPLSRLDQSAKDQDARTIRLEIRERFIKAVESRLVSDVPLGAFLSGGIDSSAVVGAMAECIEGPVHSFSVEFEDQRFSEAHWAQLIARRFGTVHTPIRLEAKDLLDSLPDILAAMDHPSGDGPNSYVVSRATKQAGVTVALSGLGGDEVFGGYPVFERAMDFQRMHWLTMLPTMVRRLGAWTVLKLRYPESFHSLAWVLQTGSVSVKDIYPSSRSVSNDKELSRLMKNHEMGENEVELLAKALYADRTTRTLPIHTQVSLLEFKTYLQNVLLRDIDQMSMAHALEVRVPFLDHRLVSYVLGIPDYKQHLPVPKQLLAEALGDLLPSEVWHRKKMGFMLPWEQWMKGELRTMCSQRIDALCDRDWVDSAALLGLWRQFLSGDKAISWSRFWYLIVLEDWLRRNDVE